MAKLKWFNGGWRTDEDIEIIKKNLEEEEQLSIKLQDDDIYYEQVKSDTQRFYRLREIKDLLRGYGEGDAEIIKLLKEILEELGGRLGNIEYRIDRLESDSHDHDDALIEPDNLDDKEVKPEPVNNKAGVYIIKKDNKVVYVGQTTNIDRRLKEHHHGFGGEVSFIKCPDDKERNALERTLIESLKPEYNEETRKKKKQKVVITTVDKILPATVPLPSQRVRAKHTASNQN
jgi:predicted GIY-YIG superfamily endonuclease